MSDIQFKVGTFYSISFMPGPGLDILSHGKRKKLRPRVFFLIAFIF